ncbi:MAG: hypothetical protein N2559_00465 [Anaerolineae bacterium]|nr:hypothetical protein [Anaerolineae bacterium]
MLPRKFFSASRFIFFSTFILYAALGWIGAFVLQTYNYDGIARIAQAFSVFSSRDPHLAAIGFVWMPLPVLSDLPLVWLLKPFGLVLWAGPLMSAFYTALALAALYDLLGDFELPRVWRVVWVLGLGAHPLIVHNGTMGLSEAPLLACLFLALRGFIAWDRENKSWGILWGGIWSALAVFCRYEAMAWVGVTTLALVWRWWLDPSRHQARALQANILAYTMPPLYALGGWVLVNWLIMKNPIYFLVGPGSTATTPDTAQAVGPSHPFAYAQNSVSGSALLLSRQIADLSPLLALATLLLIVLVLWKKAWGDLSYLALGWSILGFTFFTAWRGLLPPFTRYFFWIVPAGVIIAATAYRCAHKRWTRALTLALMTVALWAPFTWLIPRALERLPDPYPLRIVGAFLLPPEVTDHRQVRGQLDEFKMIAAYLNAQHPPRTTLLDAAIGSPLLFFLTRPETLVLTTDRDFKQILSSPIGRVDQILVPYPSFDARGRSEILKLYPAIYDGQAWTQLVHEFPGPNAWRLYRIVSP